MWFEPQRQNHTAYSSSSISQFAQRIDLVSFLISNTISWVGTNAVVRCHITPWDDELIWNERREPDGLARDLELYFRSSRCCLHVKRGPTSWWWLGRWCYSLRCNTCASTCFVPETTRSGDLVQTLAKRIVCVEVEESVRGATIYTRQLYKLLWDISSWKDPELSLEIIHYRCRFHAQTLWGFRLPEWWLAHFVLSDT